MLHSCKEFCDTNDSVADMESVETESDAEITPFVIP